MEEAARQYGSEFLWHLTGCERRLEAFVLGLVPNWADAEEVIQETKLRLWEQYDQYDHNKPFAAWAFTIARYQVLTLRNKSRAGHVALSQAFLEQVANKFAETVDQTEARAFALHGCLERLPENQRTLLQRCYGDEAITTIAEEMGRTADSLRQQLLRIRRQLHQCIDATLRREESP